MKPSFMATTAAGLILFASAGMASAQDAEIAAGKALGVPQEVVEAACQEGKLDVYSLILADEAKHPATVFAQMFPCLDVSIYAASGGAIGQRFMSEFQAGTAAADVIMNSSPAFGKRMVEGDMLMEYVPQGAENMDAQWKDEGHWYAMGLTYIGIGYNTDEITAEDQAWIDGVKTWQDVLENPFADRLAMVDIRAGGSTHLPYYYLKTELGDQSWQALADENPIIFNGINPLADQLAAGAFAFVPHATLDTAVNKRRERGAPIAWKFPEPGLGIPYFMGIASNAPHPNAAKLLMSWSLSPEGQATWVARTGLAPAMPGIDDQRDVAQQDWYALPETVYPADWDKIEAELPALVEQFAQTFGN